MRWATAADAKGDPQLLRERDALQAKAVAARTLRIYEGELGRLDKWLDGADLTDESLSLYLCVQHRAGKAASTIGTAVAAAAFRAREGGLPNPIGAKTRKTASGIRRDAAAKVVRQADPIGWKRADRMAAQAERAGTVAGLRDAALIAVGSDAMLRVSEASALDVEDVSFVVRRGMLDAAVRVRRGKTDQEGQGNVLYLGPPTARRLKRWMKAAGIADGSLFRQVRKNGVVQPQRLGVRSLQAIVKRRASEAGATGRVTWHSLRIGSAQELAARGASLVAMQRAGRWKSPAMPARYVRGQLAAKGAMARLRYDRGKRLGRHGKRARAAPHSEAAA